MQAYSGWLIAGTLIFYLLSLPFPTLTPVQAAMAWIVPVLLWQGLGKGVRNQALLLTGLGLLAHIYGCACGVPIHWQQIFYLNLPLLAMLVAVSFLALTKTQMAEDSLPRGKKAVVQTALGTHILASVINLSVLFVFGDRLQKNGVLTRVQQIILARCFCSAGWWSCLLYTSPSPRD